MLKSIINVSRLKIYQARQVVEIEAAGHEVLPGLLEEFTKACLYLIQNPNQTKSRKYQNLQLLLPKEVVVDITSQPQNVYFMLRHVIDFISGLTDRHALSLYRKIKGISLI